MNTPVKSAIVMAGYALALLGAFVAVQIQNLLTADVNAQAYGMSAFGDLILFLLAFGLLAIIPTVLAFYFLRSHEKFWAGFAGFCLVFSIAWFVAVLANMFVNTGGGHPTNYLAAVLPLVAIMVFFATPVFVVGFLLLALIAPSVRPRRFLLISAGVEVLSALCVLVNFFLFNRFF